MKNFTLLFIFTFFAFALNAQFITTWETTVANESITIPTTGGGYNYTVDWGDGSVISGYTGNATHNYATPGMHTVIITGAFPRIYFNNQGHKTKILSVEQWGTYPWSSMERSFYGCPNLQILATDAPNLSSCTRLVLTFANATSVNTGLENWITSNINNMASCFSGASSFNGDISGWNVSIVTNLAAAFKNTPFNQDISGWNVSNCLHFVQMFENASAFNQDISGWVPSSTTSIERMFSGASSFNQDLNSWDVSVVKNFFRTFYNCTSLDQNFVGWNVSSGTTLSQMFLGATLSTANYDATLIAWDALNLLPNRVFHGGNSMYCAGEAARTNMINSDGWSISDGGLDPNCSPAVPDCTTLSNPVHMQSNVDASTDLSWNPETSATGYILNVGTTSMGTDILNNQNVGNVTTYDPGNFPCGQNIFVQIIPYNASGNAVSCAEEWFTTDNVTVNASSTAETGNGFNDGTATCAPTGAAPFTFAWSNGATTQSITGLAPGNYNINVTDANGCVESETVTVIQFVCQSVSATTTNTDASCFNVCDGTLTATSAGGVAPYTYLWSNGATTNPNNGLCAGTYGVTVTDDQNCSAVASGIVGEPNQLLANASATAETGNGFNDGTATCGPAGGTGPYTYSWSNGGTSQSITGLAPGNYTVVVTDDNTCTATETVTVVQFVCPTLSFSVTNNNISCFGECDGNITVTASNGLAPYTYNWNNGATTATISNLCQGNFIITVTDANGCSRVSNYSTFEPSQINVNASATPEMGNGFNDGTATCNPTSGFTPYTYLWSNGQTTQTISNLSPGNYTVTVTDNNGCSEMETVNVVQFFCPMTLTFSNSTDASCFGICDGSITATMSGVSPFVYNWSNGGTTSTNLGLCAGLYNLTITDALNCSAVSNYTITEPAQLITNASATAETGNGFNDGTATCAPSMGSAPYTFAWSNSQSMQTITNLSPGDYTVTVTDLNGCMQSETVTVDPYVCAVLSESTSINEISCFGLCDGSVLVNAVNNGIAPFTYNWSNGANTQNISNLCSGVYGLTITDSKNCEVQQSFTMTDPPLLSINASVTPESGNGFNDGTAICTPLTGTAPFTFLWSNTQTTQTINSLTPGDYTVTVTDFNSCTASESVTVLPYICSSLTETFLVDNISCNGVCDGIISITGVSGGVAPYTYTWSNGGTQSTITDLCEGYYDLTITDSKNCIFQNSYKVDEPFLLVVNASSTNETGTNYNDGTAKCLPSGGASIYHYLWSNGETTQSISNLAPDDYTVSVTDSNSCTSTQTVTVRPYDCTTLNVVGQSTNVTCFGECDGVISISNMINGNAPYVFSWSNGMTSQSITGLCSGTYNLTVIDASNCASSVSFDISEPEQIEVNASATNETGMNSGDGTATCNPDFGIAPYSFTWNTGETTQTIENLIAGQYTVSVSDNSGCTTSESISVLAFNCSNLSINSDKSEATCFEICDASISVSSVQSGVGPYSYMWSNGETTSQLNDLCAGNYDVTITDRNNCEVTESFTINQPLQLAPTVTFTNEAGSNFNDGTAIVNPTGGSGTYSYVWNSGQVTQSIQGLSAGSYSVTVTDGNGCTAEETITISVYDCSQLTINPTVQFIDCFGSCSGSIALSAASGTNEALSFSWSNGETTENIDGLCDGNYSVTITDAADCSLIENFNLTQAGEIFANASATNETDSNLNDGTATVNPTGGSGTYTYNWSTGETTQTITDLAPDIYNVTVIDDSGCEVLATIQVLSYQCVSLQFDSEIESSSCHGACDGMITITDVINGSAPFSYNWSDGQAGSTAMDLCAGSIVVTVTDAEDCQLIQEFQMDEPELLALTLSSQNETGFELMDGMASCIPSGGTAPYTYIWNTNETIEIIENLAAGLYSVTVMDSKGCTTESSIEISNFECPQLNLVAEINSISCFGQCDGSVNLTEVFAGVGPFTYQWSEGSQTPQIDGLCFGSYYVTVTDIQNCQITRRYDISEPDRFNVSLISTPLSGTNATDGSVMCIVNGGTPGYQYLWNNDMNSSSISDLAAGEYIVTVTDENGCSKSESVIITDFMCGELELVYDQSNISCFGECDASITIADIKEGLAPFSYQWSNGETNSSVSNLCAGDIDLLVTDANDCELNFSFTVEEPEVLQVNLSITNEASFEAKDGACLSDPLGGTAPYSFVWSNGMTDASIVDLGPGDYSVTVTDANLCTAIEDFKIEDFVCPDLQIEFSTRNVSCFGECDGGVEVASVTNATQPLSYNWDNGLSTTTLKDLCAGEYQLTIVDANNCLVSQTIIIEEPEAIEITINSVVHIVNGAPGSIDLSTDAGINSIYQWTGPLGFTSDELSISDLENAGCYDLTITDTLVSCALDTTFCISEISSTTGNGTAKPEVLIYPNPTQESVMIEFEATLQTRARIEIFNSAGMKQLFISKGRNETKKLIDVSAFPDGVYIIKLTYENGSYFSEKLIVSK